MNYELILQKYMEHVRQAEGIDFTYNLNDSMASDVEFSPEEVAVLTSISRAQREAYISSLSATNSAQTNESAE